MDRRPGPAGAFDPAPLIYVEPQRSRTFGPQRGTPAGTVFYIKVLTKADNNALRLHRCGEGCKSAETIKLWQPGDYRVGDELTWRADHDGTYYLWARTGATAARWKRPPTGLSATRLASPSTQAQSSKCGTGRPD